MKGNKSMKTITNITYPAFALFAFAWFTLAPQARAVCQQGCLTNSNTVLGDDALVNNTTGTANTATGVAALHFNRTGDNNTATGNDALQFNTIGTDNTATGSGALNSNTRGVGNTAVGSTALYINTTGSNNTANGSGALFANTIGVNNTASGGGALAGNSRGNDNTAIGLQALGFNITGNKNVGNGFQALLSNTTGSRNTATGGSALYNNTTANNNTADGFEALFHNTAGARNTAIGQHALFNNNTGSSNIALGANAGGNLTIGSNNIDIGSAGVNSESNTIRIGTAQTRTFIKGISGAVVAGAQVVVNAGGQLGVAASSARFKTEIMPMNKASEAILSLKPVTFHYKHDLDPDGIPQFGLVAEEVEKVNPDLVAHDNQGKPYSVRYDAVNAMLLNEFLKEYRKVQELEANDAEQQKAIKALTAMVKEQAAQIQKVSAQLEVTKPAPQTVLNNQ
jgi:Chaperone of endosialidase